MFADFGYTDTQGLDIVDAAMSFASRATGGRLYETGIHSPFRFLTEAQAYTYIQFMYELQSLDQDIQALLFNLLGFDVKTASTAKHTVRVEVTDPNRIQTGLTIEAGFPVKTVGGVILTFDRALIIPPASAVGFVNATALQPGTIANVAPGTPLTPLKPILGVDGLLIETDRLMQQGFNGESPAELKERLAQHLRHRCLVTAEDYRWLINQQYPNAAINVSSPRPGEILITTSGANGTTLSASELEQLRQLIAQSSKLGLSNITVNPMSNIPVDVEVIAAVSTPVGQGDTIAAQLQSLAGEYFSPVATWQDDGILILTELYRIFGRSSVDYIQTVAIGRTGEALHGSNFIYDAKTERLKLNHLNVSLVVSHRSTVNIPMLSQPLLVKSFSYV